MKNRIKKKFIASISILTMLFSLIPMNFVSAITTRTTPSANAGTGNDVSSVGSVSWSNPGNITSSGTPYATAAVNHGEMTHYLQATSYHFNIPEGSTINGITVKINRQSSGTSSPLIRDNRVSLVKSGIIQDTNKAATGINWTNSGSFGGATYGNSTDLWGTTWTPEDINNINFGLALSAINANSSSSRTATVDYMQIAVTYTPASYTITSSVGTGGIISPSGTVEVVSGNNQSFTITPSTGYIVSDVLADSSSIGRANDYTFNDVSANHNISASFDGGWYAPGASTDHNVSHPEHAYSSNNEYAIFDDKDDRVEYKNFNLVVPGSSTVNGIEVAIEGNASNSREAVVDLSWNGGTNHSTTNSTTSVVNGGSDATYILGGPINTWGRSWTAGDFANSKFTVRLDATDGSGDFNLNQIQVKIYYTIAKTDQTINITTLAPGSAVYDSTFDVSATATSGLPVAITTTGGCSNVGGTVTMTSGTTDCVVHYNQAGDDTYNSAPEKIETITAVKADQTISFTKPDNNIYGDPDFDLLAIRGGSDNPVTFVVKSGPVIVTGANVHIMGAGTATITASEAGDSNYNSAPDVDQSFDIGVQEITVTADTKGKNYGESDPLLTYQITKGSLVGTDTFSGFLSRDTGEDAGIYAINRGDLALNSNYNLNYVGADLTIGQNTISVSAEAKTKTYGDSDPELTYTYAPELVEGDFFTGALSRTAGENVGDYGISQGDLALSKNYILSFTGSNLSIAPSSIIVTANLQTKTYGDSDSELTYAYTPNLVGSDAFTGILNRDVGENVGTYEINQGTLALNDNYTLDYTGADFEIIPKDLTITADDQNKLFGETFTFAGTEFNAVGLIDEDSADSVLLTSDGAGASAAVGTYPIVANEVEGTGLSNYDINYVDGTLTVTDKITPEIIWSSPDNITYGTALSGTQLNAIALDGEVTIPGEFVYTPAAGTVLNAGSEQELNVEFTPADTENYNSVSKVVYINILKAEINVTAEAKSKTVGDADPAFTYTFAPALEGEDSFSGALSRAEGEDVGIYAIDRGTLALSDNYDLIYAGADLTINHKPLVISEESNQKTDTTFVTINWTTDIPATSRVIYDTIPHSILGDAPNYGYAYSTIKQDIDPKVTSHSVDLIGLSSGVTYYYRVISSASPEVVGEEKTLKTSSSSTSGGSAGFIPPPPVASGSVVINNNEVKTASTGVLLTLAASEHYQMAISNSSDFSGAGWEAFEEEKTWNLTDGDGLKTVYAKFRNSQGGTSIIYSDTIKLDTSAPSTQTSTPASDIDENTQNPSSNATVGRVINHRETNPVSQENTGSTVKAPAITADESSSGSLPDKQATDDLSEIAKGDSREVSDNDSDNQKQSLVQDQEQKQAPGRSMFGAAIGNIVTLGTGNAWVGLIFGIFLLAIIVWIIYYYRREESNEVDLK